jgi:IclR family acetate operon transcriptional repressor
MEKLVAETGESVYLSVEGHGGTALYIGIVEGTHSVRHTSWVGRTVPLGKSAAGRALRGRIPEVGYVVVERGVEADVTAIAGQAAEFGQMLTLAAAEVSAQLSRSSNSTLREGQS